MSVSLGIEVPAGVQATIVLNNFNATSIPLVTDDSSQGYSRGSLWLWATPTFNSFFVCYDATVGAAVWRRIAIQALHNIFSVEDGSGVHVSGPIVIYGSSPFNYLEFTIAGLTRRVQNVGGLLKTIDVPGVEGRYISNDSLEVVDVPAGGTGVATLADGGVLVGNGTGVAQATAVGTADHVLTSNGAGSDPTFQDVQANIDCCRVYDSGAQSIAHNTWTALTFNSERYDAFGMHSTSSNTSRITIQRAGKYAFKGHVEFAASAIGVRNIAVRINGSTFIGVQGENTTSATVVRLSVAADWDMAVNDYAELVVIQNTGGAINVNASASWSPEFSAVRISA